MEMNAYKIKAAATVDDVTSKFGIEIQRLNEDLNSVFEAKADASALYEKKIENLEVEANSLRKDVSKLRGTCLNNHEKS